jgi:hypothetical protein
MSEGNGAGEARETAEGLGVGVDDRLEGGEVRVTVGLGGTAVANAGGIVDREQSKSVDRGGLGMAEPTSARHNPAPLCGCLLAGR